MQEKNTIEQLKSIVSEKEKRVKELENEINRLKETKSNQNENFYLNKNDTEFDFIQNRPPSSSANANQTSTLNRSNSIHMIDRETNNSSRNSTRGSKAKVNNNSLNAKTIEQRKDQTTDFKLENSELKTLYKTSEIERLRLLDLVKVLQKRIEELNEKALESDNKANEQKKDP